MDKQTQIITGAVTLVTTIVFGYAVWKFFGKGKGAAAATVVETA